MAVFVEAMFFCKYALRKLQIEKYPDMCENGHKYSYCLFKSTSVIHARGKVKWEHVHIKVKRIDHLGPYPLDSLLDVQVI